MRIDIHSAQKALKVLASIQGRLGVVKFDGRAHRITALHPLLSKPLSRGGLKWTSDSGHVRKVMVEDLDAQKKRVLYVYYGPWSSQRHTSSAYVVVFHGGGPKVEIRLSKASPPGDDKVPIVHAMGFKAGGYKDKPGMHRLALRIVRKANVEIGDEEAVIGSYRLSDGHLKPAAKRVLLNVIICALAAIEVRWRARIIAPGSKPGIKSSGKKKRLAWKKGQKIEIFLDAKFGSQEKHEKLIDDIEADLKGLGLKAEREHPHDLVVRKGHRPIIVEAKAWPKGGVLAAAIAATGQLLHYASLFEGAAPRLLLALWKAPDLKELRFLTPAHIGVIWRSKEKWAGDKLARTLLPELLN